MDSLTRPSPHGQANKGLDGAPDADRADVARRPRALLVHASDAAYTPDRMAIAAAEIISEYCELDVWLPHDASGTIGPFAAFLRSRGIRVSYLALPVTRSRRRGAPQLARDAAGAWVNLRSERIDLVYLTSSASLGVAPLARAHANARVILQVREVWEGRERAWRKLLAFACTRILAGSQTVLTSTGLRRSRRVSLLPGAGPDRRPARATRSTDRTLPRYVVADPGTDGLGHRTLLRAWDEAGCPGELQILGSAVDAQAATDIRNLVRDIVSRPQTVSVLEDVSDVATVLLDSDAVVVAAPHGSAQALTLIEAHSLSLPGISPRHEGAEEIIHDGVTGWLFDAGNVHDLAAIFRRLTRAELELAGTRARQVYERRYTVELLHRRLRAVVVAELARLPRQ